MLLVNGTVCGVNEVYGKSLRQEQHTQESPTPKNSPQECPYRSAPQALVSLKRDLQELLTRVSSKGPVFKRAQQERLTRESTKLSYKGVPQERPTRVSPKSVPEEIRRVSYKSVQQGCRARLSHMCVWHKRVVFETRECQAKVSHKRVLQSVIPGIPDSFSFDSRVCQGCQACHTMLCRSINVIRVRGLVLPFEISFTSKAKSQVRFKCLMLRPRIGPGVQDSEVLSQRSLRSTDCWRTARDV